MLKYIICKCLCSKYLQLIHTFETLGPFNEYTLEYESCRFYLVVVVKEKCLVCAVGHAKDVGRVGLLGGMSVQL